MAEAASGAFTGCFTNWLKSKRDGWDRWLLLFEALLILFESLTRERLALSLNGVLGAVVLL